MGKTKRFLAVLLAAGGIVGCLAWQNLGFAGRINKELAEQVDKMAAAIAKGDVKTADKIASTIAKEQEEIYEPMLLFKFRKKKGFGVGDTPGKIFPDGIERLIQKLARDVPAKTFVTKNKDALVEMAHRTAAIARIGTALIPVKKKNREFTRSKSEKKWAQASEDMYKASLELVKAVNSGSPASVKAAAAKLDASCTACHSVFRD